MGFFDFFKKTIQTARETQPTRAEHVIYTNKKDSVVQQSITDETFNSRQFQAETLAFALMIYNKSNNDYLAVHKALIEMQDVKLSQKQADIITERLKLFNELDSRKKRFKSIVSDAQILVNQGLKKEAFEFAYNAYVKDSSDIELIQVITQLADMFNSEDYVLQVFDKLIVINPQEAYNIEYRRALYFKTKKHFKEAIELFEKLNTELQFAWNYYQIAIIQNLLGNIDACFENLKKTFELDPNLKQDAKNYQELKNLQQNAAFILLTN
jgi:tetratricopeptide (TPR) repeat protein